MALNKFLAILLGCLSLLTVGLGLYMGMWVCFAGGLIDLYNQFSSPAAQFLPVVLAISKIMFTSFCVAVGTTIGSIPGAGAIYLWLDTKKSNEPTFLPKRFAEAECTLYFKPGPRRRLIPWLEFE